MKKIVTTLLLFITAQSLWAHALWLETKPLAEKGKAHEVNVYFAEPNTAYELTDAKEWNTVRNFDLYVITPAGEKIKLEPAKQQDRYTAAFTPVTEGQYKVIMENRNIGVVGFNPEKPYALFYYAAAIVNVGHVKHEKETVNAVHKAIPMSLLLLQKTKDSLSFLLQNVKGHKSKVTVYAPSGKVTTYKDVSEGEFSFKPKGAGLYKIEAVIVDKVPGTFRDKAYKTAYHIATAMVPIN